VITIIGRFFCKQPRELKSSGFRQGGDKMNDFVSSAEKKSAIFREIRRKRQPEVHFSG